MTEMPHAAGAPPADGEGPLSIAMVSPGWPLEACANGVATYVATIVPELRRMGHDAHVLAGFVAVDGDPAGVDDRVFDLSRADDSGMFDRLADRLIGRLDPQSAADRRQCRAILRATERMAAGQGRSVLEMEEAFGWPARVRSRCRMPLVVRLHGPWFLNGPNNGADPSSADFARRVRLEGLAIASADGVTAPSLDVLERTRAHYNLALPGAEVIPYPTAIVPPERRWRPEDAEPDLILFIGRFDRHKGGDTVVDAFARLARDRPAARLVFVGPDRGLRRDGRQWSLVDYVEHRIPGALADGRVRWLGQQPHEALDDLRRRAAVTVVASRYETFAITISEAMAVGCPLAATRAGGAAELFEHEVHGFYAEPEDPDALAGAIAGLLADPGRAATMARLAAEHCRRRYAPEVVAEATIAFYRRLLAGRAGRRSASGGPRP